MNEQLKTVVEDQVSEKEIENQILNQSFSIEGYNVAIFYTKKTSEDRYITIYMTDENTGDVDELDKIKMVSEEEVNKKVKKEFTEMNVDNETDIKPKEGDLYPDSGIDVLDVTRAFEAVDSYLYKKRHQAIEENLAVVAFAA